MTAYQLVLALWLLALALTLGAVGWHCWQWRYYRGLRRRLWRSPWSPGEEAVAAEWIHQAGMHLGLRVLLVVFAAERVALQISFTPTEVLVFGLSPFQLGLALLFMLITLWCLWWTYLERRRLRGRPVAPSERRLAAHEEHAPAGQ